MFDRNEHLQPIVIDNGSGTTRAGFAGQEPARMSRFPSAVGRVLDKNSLHQNEVFVGEQAFTIGNLRSNYPIRRGIVTNWDDMEEIWTHTFNNELNVNPEEHPVYLTEPPLNPKANREKLTQIMFERFSVPAMFINIQCVLSLFAAARSFGVVLDSGETITHSVPIYDGYALPHAILQMNVGGLDLDDYLLRNLFHENHMNSFRSLDKRKIFEIIKETHCYVSQDFGNEVEIDSNHLRREHKLPDGTMVSLAKERFECPEGLFKTELLGLSNDGCQEILYSSTMKCPVGMRNDFYSNIVLAGGSTMFPGFSARLTKELAAVVPATMRVEAVAPAQRRDSAWIGASIASLRSDQIWVSKAEYEEAGPAIVHRKCY